MSYDSACYMYAIRVAVMSLRTGLNFSSSQELSPVCCVAAVVQGSSREHGRLLCYPRPQQAYVFGLPSRLFVRACMLGRR